MIPGRFLDMTEADLDAIEIGISLFSLSLCVQS
jgi:hypothetical protein